VIDNHTCTQDFDTGDNFDSELGGDTFTGQGMTQGLWFNSTNTENFEVYLGSGKDSLAITSSIAGGTMKVDLGMGDDRLSVGNPTPGFDGLDQFNLSRLTLIGGDGADELEFNDSQNYLPKR